MLPHVYTSPLAVRPAAKSLPETTFGSAIPFVTFTMIEPIYFVSIFLNVIVVLPIFCNAETTPVFVSTGATVSSELVKIIFDGSAVGVIVTLLSMLKPLRYFSIVFAAEISTNPPIGIVSSTGISFPVYVFITLLSGFFVVISCIIRTRASLSPVRTGVRLVSFEMSPI